MQLSILGGAEGEGADEEGKVQRSSARPFCLEASFPYRRLNAAHDRSRPHDSDRREYLSAVSVHLQDWSTVAAVVVVSRQ